MAEIPSEIASSAAQTGYQAREVGRERAAGTAGQGNAAQRQTKAVDEAGSSVDTDDADTQVFTDAEGSGSLGRPFEEEETSAENEEAAGQDRRGLRKDQDGQVHLDLEV